MNMLVRPELVDFKVGGLGEITETLVIRKLFFRTYIHSTSLRPSLRIPKKKSRQRCSTCLTAKLTWPCEFCIRKEKAKARTRDRENAPDFPTQPPTGVLLRVYPCPRFATDIQTSWNKEPSGRSLSVFGSHSSLVLS